MVTLTKSTCPERELSPEFALVCDWLATNGIDELIPAEPTFMVRDNEIIYRAYRFTDGQRGYDVGNLVDGHVRILEEDRILPLLVPVTDEVRAAFKRLEDADLEQGRAFLVEVSNGGSLSEPMDAYRRRLGLTDGPTDRVSYFHWWNDTVGTELALVVEDGKLNVHLGQIDTPPNRIPRRDLTHPVVFEFSAYSVERLIEALPRLRDWMARGESTASAAG